MRRLVRHGPEFVSTSPGTAKDIRSPKPRSHSHQIKPQFLDIFDVFAHKLDELRLQYLSCADVHSKFLLHRSIRCGSALTRRAR